VREVLVEGGHVAITIALTVAGCPLRDSFENQVREHVLPLPGVDSVSLDRPGQVEAGRPYHGRVLWCVLTAGVAETRETPTDAVLAAA